MIYAHELARQLLAGPDVPVVTSRDQDTSRISLTYMHFYGVSGWDVCQGNKRSPAANCFACSAGTPRYQVVVFHVK